MIQRCWSATLKDKALFRTTTQLKEMIAILQSRLSIWKDWMRAFNLKSKKYHLVQQYHPHHNSRSLKPDQIKEMPSAESKLNQKYFSSQTTRTKFQT